MGRLQKAGSILYAALFGQAKTIAVVPVASLLAVMNRCLYLQCWILSIGRSSTRGVYRVVKRRLREVPSFASSNFAANRKSAILPSHNRT